MVEEERGSSDGRQRERRRKTERQREREKARVGGLARPGGGRWCRWVAKGWQRVVGWVHRGYGQILTIPLPRSLKRKNGGDG